MTPIESNGWDALASEAQLKARAAVVYTATNAQTHAKMRSRVDTGKMRDGWQISTVSDPNAVIRRLYNSQSYAIYHEAGTTRISAQPMLRPAFALVAPTFHAMLAEVLHNG